MRTTLSPRLQFREVVALVAAKAKERLPEAVNGRIEHAVKLVLAHDVEPQDDGTILVGSSSDALKVYRLEGHSCTCQDFQYNQAPGGWCQHRIAAGIDKRVRELLPVEPPVEPWADNDDEPDLPELVETPAPVAVPVAPLPEAPASVNVRITIGGREVQWTLRDTSEDRLAERLTALLARYPVPQPPAQPQTPAPPVSPPSPPVTGFCHVHQRSMHWNEGKEGRQGWWSHRLPEGQWCKGKVTGR